MTPPNTPASMALTPSAGTTHNTIVIRPEIDNRRIAQKDFPDVPRPTPFHTPTTIENVEHMLERAGISVRYNLIKKKLEITVPGDDGTSDNRDNVSMSKIVSLSSLNGMAVGLVPVFVEVIGDQHAYNPIADWITGTAWDGVNRLASFYATVTTRDDYPTALKETLLRKWLLSAVAAALMPSGFRNRGVLTLQGPQGIGKTSWTQSLVSDQAIRSTCVKVDHHLDSGNKDSILGAIAHWIVEISELDSSFKKDVARLKGFLTGSFDKVRRPYARVDSEYQRRTVFVATVNENNFLVDTTGNSRWWTIAVTHLDYEHDIDMQQLYAQLAVEFSTGAQWWLTSEEEADLTLVNKPHESVSVVREAVLGGLDMSLIGNTKNLLLTSSELLKLAGIEHPTNPQAKECAALLREYVGESSRINGRDKWRVPCVVLENPPRLKAVLDDGSTDPTVYKIAGFPPTGSQAGLDVSSTT